MIKFKDFMNEASAKTMKRVVVPGSGTVASMKVQIIPASAKLTKLKSIKGIDFFSANDSGKNKLIATNKTLKKNYIYVVATGYDIDDTEWINIILGDDKRAIAGIKNTFENSLEDSILKIQQQNDSIMAKMSESNINKANWDNLKEFMKKQPGFLSWEFEGDYEELVIKFKTNKQAINAQKKSNDSFTEVSAFGDSSASDSEIRVELNKEAIKAL